MSLHDSSLSVFERPAFTESVLEESTFNKSVDFSKLNSSQLLTDESATQSISEYRPSSPTSSTTLAQFEKQSLGSICRTLIDGAQKTNGSLGNISGKLTKTSSDKRAFSESLDDKKLDDESVISVEEDDGDDVMEISNMETTDIETPQEDMFSHLQPKNNVAEKESEIAKVHVVCENDEPILEGCDLSLQEDESKLFQYSFIEVGRRLWPSTAEKQMYTKGCLWSPDGTCLLVPVHLDGMHVVELPTDLYTLHELPDDRGLSNLTSAVHVKEGGPVYDFCWYPYMNSSDSSTCCWLATRQHEPIHMWDAFTGELRCSYRGYDDVDEVESAISTIFSSDGQKVIGGYKKTIKIFDTHIPGRNCLSITVKKAVSCFASTTNNDNCVTAGTWAGYINHYDLRAPKLGPLFTLGGHCGGITWLKYSAISDQNWYLFSGARKDNKILQWDMRNYTEPIQSFERSVQTNQRIYYDLTPCSKWLASGDTGGLLKLWSLADKRQHFELPVHQDCCNGVSFHSSLPIISTTSGQYHFVDDTDSDDKSKEKIVNYENSLLILWYGPLKENRN